MASTPAEVTVTRAGLVRTERLMDGMTAPTHQEFHTLWRFIKDRRDAHCILLPHPDGFELRYIFNGEVLIGAVTDDRASLLERARQWRLRLVADGWMEIEVGGGRHVMSAGRGSSLG